LLKLFFRAALAAYNGNWGDCRFSIADGRLVAKAFKSNVLSGIQKPKSGSFNEKQRVFLPETWNGGSLTRIFHSHLGKSREKPYEKRGQTRANA
jgi:hypothetical protein